jgi:hypothetical protein
MMRSILEGGDPLDRVLVGFVASPNGPRWTAEFGGERARGETLDQALRALVVKVRRAQGVKVGR